MVPRNWHARDHCEISFLQFFSLFLCYGFLVDFGDDRCVRSLRVIQPHVRLIVDCCFYYHGCYVLPILFRSSSCSIQLWTTGAWCTVQTKILFQVLWYCIKVQLS